MKGGSAFAEIASAEALQSAKPAWRALAERAAEPNVFSECAFLASALTRLAPARRVMTLLIWRDQSRSALIGLVALREGLMGRGLVAVWRSEQAGLAAMAFDRDAIVDALASILAWLRRERPAVAGLMLSDVEPTGPLADAARMIASRAALRLEAINPRRRAAWIVADAEGLETAPAKKRRKEWARQYRRLAERGRLEARVSTDAQGIARFLALEARGWKGEQGTALSADSARDAFAREMLGAFSELGRLRIHELALDDAPIAMGVELRAGPRAFYWKTAYDESLASYSPGVQLTRVLTQRLTREPGLRLVDSCATQDHPMIDRLWPGRIELVDIALAATTRSALRFGAWLTIERTASALRVELKRLAYAVLGRRRS